MPFSKIFKKASCFILRSQTDVSSAAPSYSDGEVIYCKNNVCVHPPALIRHETDILHHPGYLTVMCKVVDDKRTLILSWIPNTTLRQHPSTVEQRSLSVTRVEDSHAKEKETRRLSASSILSIDHSRRNSSSSYETECSGCFPENQTSLSPLTPLMSLKANERKIFSSSYFLSSDDNVGSLCLRPTERIKYFNACPSDYEKDKSVLKLNNERTNDETNNSENHDHLVDCKCTSSTSSDAFPDVNVKRDLSKTQTHSFAITDYYLSCKNRLHFNEHSLKTDDESVILTNDQTNVPNRNISNLTDNEQYNPSVSEKDLSSVSEDDTLVPKNDFNNIMCSDKITDASQNSFGTKIDNNICDASYKGSSDIINNSNNHCDKKKVEIPCNLSNNCVLQKRTNTQCTFTRPDGIVYIDSLVLQDNPHLLTKAVVSDDIIVSKFIIEKNALVESDCENSIKKRNIDNFKVEEPKKLPLRSYEESFDPSWMSSPELLALKHNLNFPESVTASPVVRRTQKCCRKFCVDLSQMRSLRLFFSDAESTRGQLVIASRECQYKILHFHHSGLERLAAVLKQWHLLTVVPNCDNLPYRHFMVCKPAVHDNELHPEEGKVGMVTMTDWLEMLNPLGQVEDDLTLRKGIFLGGLDPCLRKIVWPFLLHCFSYQSTADERQQILTIRRREYEQIRNRRLSLEGAAKERFVRNIQCIVEKDVIRTDRGNPYYAGESNPHVDTMKNILLNYAVYDAGLGYLQGMSDLLAPLLAEIHTEADAFWCFVGLMRRTIFVCTPTDSDMDRNLSYLKELIREMVPDFYKHLQRHTDAMELLFCHRWILLCFKREFPEEMALKMWEACWANYLTDYFNLFICLAIVSAYADDVIAQDLRTDEMLLHFSSLAMFMDGELILRKARGLLYQFRQKPVIPCTLAGLCTQCGPGMWDSGHAPTVECRGPDYCKQNPCPYRGISGSGSSS